MVAARAGAPRGPRGDDAEVALSTRRLLVAFAAVLAAVWLLALGSSADAPAQGGFDCQGDFTGGFPDPDPAEDPLGFGIYPGGVAGQVVGPPADPKPEDRREIVAALDELSGERHFVVHLYISFTGTPAQRKAVRRAKRQARRYSRNGYGVEYVLAYRPADRAGAPDVRKYVRFSRRMVRRFGRIEGVEAIQVTNEVNNTLSPDASDGAYPGARAALVRGVVAAARKARKVGRRDIEIGFNWFHRLDPSNDEGFWTELGETGGRRFARSVDWVGLDVYPGTFFPPPAVPRADAVINAMSYLRECMMPLAGLGDSVPIHVSENGWPTAPPARSYEEQATALEEMVRAVDTYRANYGVTDYRWFDLRDADSSSPNFQQQFGLMRDDYTPKPAFDVYRDLIAELG